MKNKKTTNYFLIPKRLLIVVVCVILIGFAFVLGRSSSNQSDKSQDSVKNSSTDNTYRKTYEFTSLKEARFSFNYSSKFDLLPPKENNTEERLILNLIGHEANNSILIDIPNHGIGEDDSTISISEVEKGLIYGANTYSRLRIYKNNSLFGYVFIPDWTDKLSNIEVYFNSNEWESVESDIELVLSSLKIVDDSSEIKNVTENKSQNLNTGQSSQTVKADRIPVLIPVFNKTVYCDKEKESYVKDIFNSFQKISDDHLSNAKACYDNCSANYRNYSNSCITTNFANDCLRIGKETSNNCINNCKKKSDLESEKIKNDYAALLKAAGPYCSLSQ